MMGDEYRDIVLTNNELLKKLTNDLKNEIYKHENFNYVSTYSKINLFSVIYIHLKIK